MTMRTQIRAGAVDSQHSEAMRFRSTVKAGGQNLNHNEALRTGSAPAVAMLRQPRTTSRKGDRLELLVIRAGLRARRRQKGSRH